MSAHREHDPELIECHDCGSTFDLARQRYYDNYCPDCVDEERLKRSCAVCDDEHFHAELRGVMSHSRDGRHRIQVCSRGCKLHAQAKSWAPRGPALSPGDEKFGTQHGE